MSRERIRQLSPAVDLAHDHVDEAARMLHNAQSRLQTQRARVGQLQQFRSEYIERFYSDGRNGLSARRVQDYHAFIAGLDANIEQARKHVEILTLETENLRKRWLASRARAQALDGVVEQYRDEVRRQEGRREQAENDEFAASRHRQRRHDEHD